VTIEQIPGCRARAPLIIACLAAGAAAQTAADAQRPDAFVAPQDEAPAKIVVDPPHPPIPHGKPSRRAGVRSCRAFAVAPSRTRPCAGR
jgi:hypothetical protein